MKTRRMWMAGYLTFASYYGIYHTRKELERHLDEVEPKWRHMGLRVMRVTVSPNEGRP